MSNIEHFSRFTSAVQEKSAEQLQLSDSDVRPLTISNYPVGITDAAKPLWKKVVAENRPLLRKFNSLVDRWVAAILLFKEECARHRVAPFKPDIEALSLDEALRYMKQKAAIAAELYKDFVSHLSFNLTPDCTMVERVPQLLGPEQCPLYAAMQCYQFVVPIIIKSKTGPVSLTDIAACVRKATYTLCDQSLGLHRGPARDGVRSLCYIVPASTNSAAVTWIGSVFAKEFTTLRGIKTKILNEFKAIVGR